MRSRLLLSDDWTFYDLPWGMGLAAIFLSFVAEGKFGLPLLCSGVFKEFETLQQKKNGVNYNSQQENVTHTKPKVNWHKNTPD